MAKPFLLKLISAALHLSLMCCSTQVITFEPKSENITSHVITFLSVHHWNVLHTKFATLGCNFTVLIKVIHFKTFSLCGLVNTTVSMM